MINILFIRAIQFLCPFLERLVTFSDTKSCFMFAVFSFNINVSMILKMTLNETKRKEVKVT